MAGFRLKPIKEEPQVQEVESKLVSVLYFCKKEGWYMLKEIEIPLDILESKGKVVHETLPDIFAILLGQVTGRVRKIFDI